MTIKNAIKMIEFLRDWEMYGIKVFNDRPFDDTSQPDRIRKTMLEISQIRADRLAKVLSELQAVKQHRLPKKCRHPKEDHAITSDGQKYCMNCNADL
jgi:hypothetical protein